MMYLKDQELVLAARIMASLSACISIVYDCVSYFQETYVIA